MTHLLLEAGRLLEKAIPSEGTQMNRAILREQLAELYHEQWSGWMEYLFEKGKLNGDGTWTMPVWAVARWKRQSETLYPDLSEVEKDCDRMEADRVLSVLGVKL